MNRKIQLLASVSMLLMLPFSAFAELKIKPQAVEYQDEKGVALKNPEGVGCGSNGTIVVADTGNGRLVKFQLQGGVLSSGTEIRTPQIVYPVKLAMTPGNGILALDGRTRKIVQLAADGIFQGYLEVKGIQGSNSIVPKGVAADNSGQVYLLDASGLRVLVLDKDGVLKRTVPIPPEAGFISDIAVDARGTIFALDSIGFRVYKATSDKDTFVAIASNLNASLEFSSNITIDPRGSIFLVDQDGGAIVVLGPDGSFQGRQLSLGWKQGALYYPSQICVSDNSMAVADRNNNRIQVFSLGR